MAKSLQTLFVKYYREKLEPLGFKKVKGRQPYFVRVVNDEILHIFTYAGIFSTEYGYRAFNLLCGIATVYKQEINFKATPRNNEDWLRRLGGLNETKDTQFPVVAIPRNLMEYYYNDENVESIPETTYEGAKILLSILDKVTDMESALRFIMNNDAKDISFRRMLNEDDYFDEEGLYFARKGFDYKIMDKYFADRRLELKNSLWSEDEKREHDHEINEWEEELRENRQKFINNDEDYQRGMELLRKHYNDNIDNLRGYGLDIQKKDLEFLFND